MKTCQTDETQRKQTKQKKKRSCNKKDGVSKKKTNRENLPVANITEKHMMIYYLSIYPRKKVDARSSLMQNFARVRMDRSKPCLVCENTPTSPPEDLSQNPLGGFVRSIQRKAHKPSLTLFFRYSTAGCVRETTCLIYLRDGFLISSEPCTK